MEQRVSLITLCVSDLERARRFYESLGWTTGAAPDDDVVFFQTGGMIVALWDRASLAEDSGVEDGGGWGGVALAYNVRSPAEVDAVLAEADAAGATIPRWGAESRSRPSSTTTRQVRRPYSGPGRSGISLTTPPSTAKRGRSQPTAIRGRRSCAPCGCATSAARVR